MKTNEQMAEEVEKLFDFGRYGDGKVTVKDTVYKGHPAKEVVAGQMYERPEYTGGGGLVGMLNGLMAACEGNMVADTYADECDGCETCDYGSFYAKAFIVWKE